MLLHDSDDNYDKAPCKASSYSQFPQASLFSRLFTPQGEVNLTFPSTLQETIFKVHPLQEPDP